MVLNGKRHSGGRGEEWQDLRLDATLMKSEMESSIQWKKDKVTYTTLRSTRDVNGVDNGSGNDESEDGETHGCCGKIEMISMEYTRVINI